MKKIMLSTLILLLQAGGLFLSETTAQSAQQPAQSAQQPVNQASAKVSHTTFGGINLSLWPKFATQPYDTLGSTWLNVGLISKMNRMNGLSVNALASLVGRDVNGIQLSGIVNITGQSMRGVQIGGIANVNGNELQGVSLGGLVNITGNESKGVMGSGLVTIGGNQMQGVSLGGLLNISGNQMSGLQLSGMANITGNSTSGISLSGLLNVAGSNTNGLQIAGLCNVTGQKMRGVQIAPLNVAVSARGVQIGLLNYNNDSISHALQLGLVNLTPYTRYQLMMGVGNSSTFDVGARFKNRHWYTILGLGTGYHHMGSKFNASAFYRAGVEYTLYKRLSLSGDLGYRHIEGFSNKHHGHPTRLYALQFRAQLNYRFSEKFALFAGSGYSDTRRYGGGKFDNGALAEFGVILF